MSKRPMKEEKEWQVVVYVPADDSKLQKLTAFLRDNGLDYEDPEAVDRSLEEAYPQPSEWEAAWQTIARLMVEEKIEAVKEDDGRDITVAESAKLLLRDLDNDEDGAYSDEYYQNLKHAVEGIKKKGTLGEAAQGRIYGHGTALASLNGAIADIEGVQDLYVNGGEFLGKKATYVPTPAEKDAISAAIRLMKQARTEIRKLGVEGFEADLAFEEAVVTHYVPKNPATFASLVTKMADRLGASFNQVAYHVTLDPKYYDADTAKDDFNFADTEYALGISDAQSYEDQAEGVRSAYALDDQELEELLASERHWASQGPETDIPFSAEAAGDSNTSELYHVFSTNKKTGKRVKITNEPVDRDRATVIARPASVYEPDVRTVEPAVSEATDKGRAKRLDWINSHRKATGHPPVPADASDKELKRHEHLIDLHAPYGEDPWGNEE